MRIIEPSELILNADGSIFHLHTKPEDIAETIILVGDQGRVSMVSSFFDTIELKKQNREFVTHTGTYRGKRISVVSTGIGTDNIDIVVNELDALANIDLQTRTVRTEHRKLTLIRIGTSGALQDDIEPNTPVATELSIGFDGVLNYYRDRNKVAQLDVEAEFVKFMDWNPLLAKPYFVPASGELLAKVAAGMRKGMTISAAGFYGPQGRELRLPIADNEINQKLSKFKNKHLLVTNYEMESSAIYGLSALLGHDALTICNIIANRKNSKFGGDYQTAIKKLIATVLDRITA